jgi:uncharacterized protein (DUF58 family)
VGLTRNGVLLGLGCVAAAVPSWLFGLPEVAALAAGGMVLLVVAVVWVQVGSPDLAVGRSARPPRLEVGQTCEIRLVAHNRSRRSSPVMTLEDDVGRHGTARLVLAPLAPGGRCVATYSLPTSRRGLHHVGPLTTTVEDPFGLARRTRRDSQVLSVIVLPHTSTLATMPPAPGDEPEHGTHSLTSASTVDEEFAALRDYVPGDDVRRIHWRSTARRGAPVVRQFDVPWQRRTTVVLDLRAGTDDASFERAVSAAASVVLLASRRDELVRLMTTGGADSGFVPAAEQVDELTDRLAVVSVDPPRRDRPEPLLGLLGQLGSTSAGRVVTCTAGLTATDAAGLGRAARGIGLHIVVATGTSAPGVRATGTVVLADDGRQELSTVWESALAIPEPVVRR